MKWITGILLIYLVTLFGVPCSDSVVIHNDSIENTNALSHSHDTEDYCSPFCACACCSVSIAMLKINLPEFSIPLQEFGSNKQRVKKYFAVSNYSGSIWQPPKFNV